MLKFLTEEQLNAWAGVHGLSTEGKSQLTEAFKVGFRLAERIHSGEFTEKDLHNIGELLKNARRRELQASESVR